MYAAMLKEGCMLPSPKYGRMTKSSNINNGTNGHTIAHIQLSKCDIDSQ